MSRSARSSSSQRIAMAVRRTKWRAIPSQQTLTIGVNAFARFVTSGRTIVARVADMLVSNGCSGAIRGRRRERLSRRPGLIDRRNLRISRYNRVDTDMMSRYNSRFNQNIELGAINVEVRISEAGRRYRRGDS